MTATLLSKRNFGGYEYTEVISDGSLGEAIIIPLKEITRLICSVIASTNVGKFQFSTSLISDIQDNSAVWQDWPKGEISGTVYDTLICPVTALRGVSISGEITIEVVGYHESLGK